MNRLDSSTIFCSLSLSVTGKLSPGFGRFPHKMPPKIPAASNSTTSGLFFMDKLKKTGNKKAGLQDSDRNLRLYQWPIDQDFRLDDSRVS